MALPIITTSIVLTRLELTLERHYTMYIAYPIHNILALLSRTPSLQELCFNVFGDLKTDERAPPFTHVHLGSLRSLKVKCADYQSAESNLELRGLISSLQIPNIVSYCCIVRSRFSSKANPDIILPDMLFTDNVVGVTDLTVGYIGGRYRCAIDSLFNEFNNLQSLSMESMLLRTLVSDNSSAKKFHVPPLRSVCFTSCSFTSAQIIDDLVRLLKDRQQWTKIETLCFDRCWGLSFEAVSSSIPPKMLQWL